MARTINEIQENIIDTLQSKFTLSPSAVAEWRLWVTVYAYCIYTFELILDNFKTEVNTRILATRAGTAQWYADNCYKFQNGHELKYNEESGTLFYETDDPAARIAAVVAVHDNDGTIVIQVAKEEGGKLEPFTLLEKLNFENYINEIKFAGSKTSVISTNGDEIKYNVIIYYNPAYPQQLIEERTSVAIEEFKTSQTFGGVVYPARFVDNIMKIEGVVTVKLNDFLRKGATENNFSTVDVFARLDAGYFNYNDECILNYEPTRNLTA